MRLHASNQAKRRDFVGKRTLRRHHSRTRFVCTAEHPKSALCRSKRIRRIKMARTNVPEGQLPSRGTLVPWARGVHARSSAPAISIFGILVAVAFVVATDADADRPVQHDDPAWGGRLCGGL